MRTTRLKGQLDGTYNENEKQFKLRSNNIIVTWVNINCLCFSHKKMEDAEIK